jgi:ubiquinone biosynthesis protein
LESLPPSVPLATINEILARELGMLELRGITLSPPAIAEASVAVVIPFQDAKRELPHGGVFKILKPGIEERLELELELLSRVGAHMDERCWELSIPQLDYRDTFEQVREKLYCEVQLEREQQHLVEAKALFADNERVLVPALVEHSTPRVTAMERVTGEKITEHRLDSAADRSQLASLVTQALVAEPLFSRASRAMFHCDPHAGNLFYTDDGRLAILDWSLVGHLGEAERIAMGQLALSAITLDADRIVGILAGLSERRKANLAALGRVTDDWLRKIRRGQTPGLNWIVGLLDEASRLAGLRVGTDMMLLRKSLLTLEGVIGELGADDFRMEDALFREFVRHFGCEWPDRWLSWPTSRAFATRLSNLDLTETMLGLPLAAARYWQAEWLDLLRSERSVTS